MTWAEDRAPVGTDSSADPGARPKDGRPSGKFAARLSSGLRDGIKAVNPSRQSREQTWQELPENGGSIIRNAHPAKASKFAYC